MGRGLFLVDGAKKNEDLIPYTLPHLIKAEYKKISRTKRYTLQEEEDTYINGDVEKGNVAGYINSSFGQNKALENIEWIFEPSASPWNAKQVGYIMTRTLRDILPGEEIYASYHGNF